MIQKSNLRWYDEHRSAILIETFFVLFAFFISFFLVGGQILLFAVRSPGTAVIGLPSFVRESSIFDQLRVAYSSAALGRGRFAVAMRLLKNLNVNNVISQLEEMVREKVASTA